MEEFKDLVVVSSAHWLAKDFAAANIINVIPELGLDMPNLDMKTTAWWCPGIYVARAEATGVRLPLLSSGVQWLPNLPDKLLRRKIEAMQLRDVAERFTGGFIKPAEIKINSLPARVYEGGNACGEFLSDAQAVNLPSDSWIYVSEPISYEREYRCFTAYGRVTAVSAYLLHGVTWDGLEPDTDRNGKQEAAEFTNALLDSLSPDEYPPGFVVDVGYDNEGNWSVIEANASWSSNPYHSDMSGVIESVLAAHDVHGKYPQWAWQLDSYHQRNARKLYRG